MTDVRAVPRAFRELGRRLAALDRTVRDQAMADQADSRAVTDGSIDIYDDDGELRGRLGKQADGSYAVKAFSPKPEIPTEPDVLPVPGGCVVEWDGTFEDVQEEPVQRVAIHVGLTPDFAIDTGDDEDSDGEATERAAILSPRGGSAFLALDPGEGRYWIRLTAVGEGGVESDPSPAVEVVVSPSEVVFEQDAFVLPQAGPQDLTLRYTPVDNSEHVYWCGLYQPEDITWTRIGQTVSLLDTGFPPKEGDLVVVEYAYIAGEQPEVIPLDGESQQFSDSLEPWILGGFGDIQGGDWTVELLWSPGAYPAAGSNNEGTIVENSTGIGSNTSWRLRFDSNKDLKFYVRDGGTGGTTVDVPVPSFKYEIGRAYHIALTKTGTGTAAEFKLYVNGSIVAGFAPTVYSPKSSLTFGGPYFGSAKPAQRIDEVAAYDHVLTAADLQKHIVQWDRGGYPAAILASNPYRYLRLPGTFDVVTGVEQGQIQNPGRNAPAPAIQKADGDTA